jgi:hypothetical protein
MIGGARESALSHGATDMADNLGLKLVALYNRIDACFS